MESTNPNNHSLVDLVSHTFSSDSSASVEIMNDTAAADQCSLPEEVSIAPSSVATSSTI